MIEKATAIERKSITSELKIDDKLIIQVSAFREQKDQLTLIRAMALLPDYTKLLLVGEGVMLPFCERLTKELKLEKRVFFLGIRTDVPNLLKSSDIIVLSSHYEGLSLASIEGMASSKPFVASDVPGLSDLVSGVGVLFPLGNEKKLASIINKLLDNKEYYNKVVNSCLQESKNYDIKIMVDNYINVYRNII